MNDRSPTTGELVQTLDRCHGERREKVAEELAVRAERGDSEAVEALVHLLATEAYDNAVPSLMIQHSWYMTDPNVRLRVVRALLRDEDALSVMLDGRTTFDAFELVVLIITEAQSRFKYLMPMLIENAGSALRSIVRHPESAVRLKLTKALAAFVLEVHWRQVEAADALLKELSEDEDAEVRSAAKAALLEEDAAD